MTGFPLDPAGRARVREGWAEQVWARDDVYEPWSRVDDDLLVLGFLPACRDGDHDRCTDDGTGCLCPHHVDGDS